MIIPVLVRNETIKTTRRLAFWAALGMYAVLVVVRGIEGLGASERANNPLPFHFPVSWPHILSGAAPIGTFFVAITLMLLIASEFSWRTARQNVIDGLSKEQWFLGKLLLVPGMGLVFITMALLIGTVFGALGDRPPGEFVFMRSSDVAAFGGFALAIAGYSSLALLLATTIRSAGAAVGVFFLYVAFLERIFANLADVIRDGWGEIREYLPTQIFNELLSTSLWDAGARQRMFDQAARLGRPAPEFADGSVIVVWALGYMILFVSVAFLTFRRRDL